jgi:hypothetical protein
MSRFRGQWFDDADREWSGLPPAAPAADAAPWIPIDRPPRRLRGRWLDADEPEETVAEPGGAGSGRVKILPVPKWTAPAYGAAALAFTVLAFIAILGNTNVGRALVVLPVLAYIAYVVAQRLATLDGQPAIVQILMGGLAVKFLGVLARYWISLQVYGRSDATEYVSWGRQIAPGLRHFEVIDIGRLTGTGFIRLLTGIVFAITPASPMVGFIVFGFFGYIGMILFWRAFKRAFPGVDDLKYLQVLMLLPSLAFWPSSIGKEAWMVLGVGLASYGVASILANRTIIGWATFTAGMYAVLWVRPHVGIAMLVGLAAAELFRSRGSQGATRAGLSIVLLFFVGGVVMSSAAAFLGIGNWSKASVDQELTSVSDRTSEGRSEFTPTPVNSPVQFPQGAFTVLFRPMPYETHSPQEFASAIENVALLGVIGFSLPRLAASFRRARARPFLIYCVGTLITFVVMYSSFSNFALIARQRTQVSALLLVFLCMPREQPVKIDPPKVRGAEPNPQT